jgi:hypothetical protein
MLTEAYTDAGSYLVLRLMGSQRLLSDSFANAFGNNARAGEACFR